MFKTEMKKLAEGKLTFALEGMVPSEEDLSSRREVLATSIAKYAGLRLLQAGVLCALLIFPAGFLAAYLLSDAFVLPVAAACGVVTVVFLQAAFQRDKLVAELIEEARFLDVIDRQEADALVGAVRGSPEVAAYRNKVIEAGREFVQAEWALLVGWAQQQRGQAKLAELYEGKL